jgi:hypothetical protein
MLRLETPLGQQRAWFIIKKFNVCWVPDFEGKPNLAGEYNRK